MADQEGLEDDLFADLYDADESTARTTAAVEAPNPEPAELPPSAAPAQPAYESIPQSYDPSPADVYATHAMPQQSYGTDYQNGSEATYSNPAAAAPADNDSHGTGIKEDGKMFIGGLNWETTDQSLRDYFSQFGEVQECTVMRDSATGRSRGFGFLTFRDPKTVNTVMVKEHYLDGKIIDPKRAIPRDEQEKTSKIFVGGVSQEATEQDFKQFFMQFGRVVDATLMIDKDTGRPRGFGFVTFDSETAVENALSRPLEILGKAIEVKKAQPRGNLRDEDRGGRRGGRDGGFRDMNHGGNGGGGGGGSGGGGGGDHQQGGQQGMNGGMTPQMMAQYWQRMQQYFAMMQQQMAMTGQGQGMPPGMGMAGMNPAMMQQMQQMQQQQQQMKGMGNNQQQGSMSPNPQSPGSQASMPNMMNPSSMMQPMQNPSQGSGGNGSASPGPNAAYNRQATGPGYNAQEQIAFEQQKYEQQQVRRQMDGRAFSPYQQGGPTSWEGMYDEVPQPNIPSGPQGITPIRSMDRYPSFDMRRIPTSSSTNLPLDAGSSAPPSTAPANAPTGPRNAGKPGANYRGGGRGGHRGFHPYSR
ncbi:hypothetical protein N7456_008265 [Penicillium angulare]|uniref:RRM domain-containing protein n=1 Tax=Penicillium angulare TaxID=116970 RepID=A0A9W9K8Y8_9EURO|nr:hypothetical protein N7456_008265 [Penicillium angulare]